MFQIHKYDPSLLKPLAKLAQEHYYGAALLRMEQLKQELPSFCELCIVDSNLAHETDDGIVWRTVPCLFVTLEAVGNPDYGQYGTLVRAHTVAARDIPHASELCMAFIDRENLGGGNWGSNAGRITDHAGRVVGRVSYNGKVWAPGACSEQLWPPPRLAPAFPAPVASEPKAPSPLATPANDQTPPFKVGDKVTGHLRQGDPTPYTVQAVSKSGAKLTLTCEVGARETTHAYRDSTGKYRVKEGGFLRPAGAS